MLRCECKVVEGGIEYKSVTCSSLSAAALAASKDLGLGAKTIDGWAWWDLKTREVAPAKKELHSGVSCSHVTPRLQVLKEVGIRTAVLEPVEI